MIQTLPPNRAYQAFGVWILPQTLRCCQNLLNAQRPDSKSNLSTVPTVAIAEKIEQRLGLRTPLRSVVPSKHRPDARSH